VISARRPRPSAGRDVVERATRDLMAAEFGLAGFGPGQLKEIFDLFRELRLAAGDFVPEIPEVSADPGEA
jgi:hypothetical protein